MNYRKIALYLAVAAITATVAILASGCQGPSAVTDEVIRNHPFWAKPLTQEQLNRIVEVSTDQASHEMSVGDNGKIVPESMPILGGERYERFKAQVGKRWISLHGCRGIRRQDFLAYLKGELDDKVAKEKYEKKYDK
jgi:hypothetical protein